MTKEDMKKIRYIDGLYKCEVIEEWPNGNFTYKPFEGVPDNQIGKIFNSNTSVYSLTNHQLKNKPKVEKN